MSKGKLTWAQRKWIIESSPAKGYMNIKDAAAYLDVSTSTLRNWERAGKLVSSRHPINGYRQYIKSDLDSIIDFMKERHKEAKYGRNDFPSNLKKNEEKEIEDGKKVVEVVASTKKEEDNHLFNIKQASEFLGVSPSTIKKWIAEKNILVLLNPDNNQGMVFRRDLQAIIEEEKNKKS